MSKTNLSSCSICFIAAPASGQGKTVFCAALARWFKNRGKRVQVFKMGPDYLDPTILELASGQTVANLDLWIMGEQHCRQRLTDAARVNDIILIESVMGLHDNQPSNAEFAALFNLPVTVIIDVAKFAQTATAIVAGLSQYGVGANINAVIGNRVGSDNHHSLMKQAMAVNYAGSLRRDPRLEIPHRHLGLVRAQELSGLDRQLDQASEVLAEIDLSLCLTEASFDPVAAPSINSDLLAGCNIAIARDQAFSFIYPANIELLELMGAKLKYFSPLQNQTLPDCDALWLPGGYPELHLKALSRSDITRRGIIEHGLEGKPLLGECGGMMYLANSITSISGESFDMCGFFKADCNMQSRLQSVGLQSVDYGQGEIRGHTFHHSRLSTTIAAETSSRRQNGEVGEAVYRHAKARFGYLHHFFYSNPDASAKMFR